MKRIHDFKHLIEALRPFLAGPEPLERLRQSGAVLDGAIAETLRRARPPQVLSADFLARLQHSYGAVPPLRVQVASPPLEPPAPGPSGFGLVVATDLAILNEMLAALYRAGTIPHELDADTASRVIGIDELKQLCSGIPDDATLGSLAISLPVVSAGVESHRNLHAHIDLSLGILSAAGSVALLGSLELEIPLDLEVTAGHVVTLGIRATEPTGTLTTRDGSPPVRPRSEQARQKLEEKCLSTASKVLVKLREVLSFQASIPVQKTQFPNSTIDVVQAGAVTLRRSNREFVILGANVETLHEAPDIDALASQPLPEGINNLRATISESFAADALSSIITSGDLDALLGGIIDRHSHGLSPVYPQVENGRVVFRDGSLQVALDCLFADACAFGKDLNLTAKIEGTAVAVGGKLSISTSNVDFDLDNTDALLCSVLGALLGPFGLIIAAGALAFLTAYNPNAPDGDLPVSRLSDPLPGTDQVVGLQLVGAETTPGVLTADGRLQLITDPVRLYVHLRVVQGHGPVALAQPLVGATVELYELDNPAPAHDDVDIPDVGSTSQIAGNRYLTTRTTSYTPRADQLLGTATTDPDGRVTFITFVNSAGGTADVVTTREDLWTNRQLSSTIEHRAIAEAYPDLAVTIRGASGHALAQQRLLALNLVGKRLGRFDAPFVVTVPRDVPVVLSPRAEG